MLCFGVGWDRWVGERRLWVSSSGTPTTALNVPEVVGHRIKQLVREVLVAVHVIGGVAMEEVHHGRLQLVLQRRGRALVALELSKDGSLWWVCIECQTGFETRA